VVSVRRLGRALAVVTLLAAAGIGIGARPAAAAEGSVAFADPAPETIEDRPAVRVVVDRVDLPVSKLVVTYSTEDGTATGGSDYVPTSGSLVFDVGVRQATFVVQVRDDRVAEPTEHLVLRLTADRSSTTARLTILDDDADSAGTSSASDPARMSTAPAATASKPEELSASSAAVVSRPEAAPVRRRVVAAPARRRVVLRQSPVTPFELRPSAPAEDASGSLPNEPTVVDPVLALLAGLLLARVSAEVWFRARTVAA
jgi:hypothetical protein